MRVAAVATSLSRKVIQWYHGIPIGTEVCTFTYVQIVPKKLVEWLNTRKGLHKMMLLKGLFFILAAIGLYFSIVAGDALTAMMITFTGFMVASA